MDINKLLEPYKKDEELKERTFNTIMKKVHNKIYFASSNRSMETIFEVPVVVFGSPLYNTKEACAYIMVKLLNEGFYTKAIELCIKKNVTQNNRLTSINRSLNRR